MLPTPEPFSRILIDKALAASNWNLLEPQQMQVGGRLEEGFQAVLHRTLGEL